MNACRAAFLGALVASIALAMTPQALAQPYPAADQDRRHVCREAVPTSSRASSLRNFQPLGQSVIVESRWRRWRDQCEFVAKSP
jgi:hypothetical protein